MKKKKERKLKRIPNFKSDAEEREFWAKHEASDYFDFEKPLEVDFINLKPSTRSVTVRMPESLLSDLKMLENKRDFPYQSLMKILLAERVKEEVSSKR